MHLSPKLTVAHAQILLLALARTTPSHLKDISTMPDYNEGLSNHLSASMDRIRFLGMIVGESISRKIDLEERRLKFKVPETEHKSAESWRSLIDVDDELAEIKDLQSGITEEVQEASGEDEGIMKTEEFLVDDADEMDEGLQSYPAPESDAEDSDDDPTVVSHEKTPIPLYCPYPSTG